MTRPHITDDVCLGFTCSCCTVQGKKQVLTCLRPILAMSATRLFLKVVDTRSAKKPLEPYTLPPRDHQVQFQGCCSHSWWACQLHVSYQHSHGCSCTSREFLCTKLTLHIMNQMAHQEWYKENELQVQMTSKARCIKCSWLMPHL